MGKDDIEYIPKRDDWLDPRKHKLAYRTLGKNKRQVKRISSYDKTNLYNPHGHTNIVVKLRGDSKWWDLNFLKPVYKFKKIG